MNSNYYRPYSNQTPRRKNHGFKPFLFLVIFLVFAALFLRACISFVGSIMADNKNEAVLSVLRGSAEVKVWGSENFEEAANAQILLEGDTVRSGNDSWISLRFQGGAQIFIDENTTLHFSGAASDVENTESEPFVLDLEQGRALLTYEPEDFSMANFSFNLEVMDVSGEGGVLLLENTGDEEAAYVFDGRFYANFTDPSDEEKRVIESTWLESGYMSYWDAERKLALVNRQHVPLFGSYSQDLFANDVFVSKARGVIVAIEDEELVEEDEDLVDDEEIVEEEEPDEELDEELEEEPIVEEEAEPALRISIVSPQSPFVLEGSAIALEGVVVAGEAEKISVEWSGNGTEYPLGLFASGDENFRYVADFQYGNLASGKNVYTIRAYGADGVVSNTVSVEIVVAM